MSEKIPKEIVKIGKMSEERLELEENQTILKRKRFFYYTVIAFIGLFISALMFDYYSEKNETADKIIVDTLGENYPKISTSMYFLGEFNKDFEPLFEHYKMEKKSLSDSLDVTVPSIFVLNAEESIFKADRIIIDLLKANHVVFFVGTNMEPAKILPFFSEFDIPFVPVEGTLPTYFQGYGAMYSIKSKTIIPVFAASNSENSLDLRAIANSFSVFDEHIVKKENNEK